MVITPIDELIDWIDGEAMPHKATQPPTRKAVMLDAIRTHLLAAQGMAEAIEQLGIENVDNISDREIIRKALSAWEGK